MLLDELGPAEFVDREFALALTGSNIVSVARWGNAGKIAKIYGALFVLSLFYYKNGSYDQGYGACVTQHTIANLPWGDLAPISHDDLARAWDNGPYGNTLDEGNVRYEICDRVSDNPFCQWNSTIVNFGSGSDMTISETGDNNIIITDTEKKGGLSLDIPAATPHVAEAVVDAMAHAYIDCHALQAFNFAFIEAVGFTY